MRLPSALFIFHPTIVSLFVVSNLLLPSLSAATLDKADNADALNLPSSWVSGVVPGSNDIARWNDIVTTGNSVVLGANTSWKGIAITNPGGTVTIGTGNTLTLGAGGFDLSAATQNLTVQSNLTLAGGNQIWNVVTGRTLLLSTGTFTRAAGTTLNLQGTGTFSTSMAGLANGVSGIIGAWATTGTGVDTRYVTISGGDLAAYTGATAAATFSGIPTGSAGANINYDVSAGHSGLGSTRSANTIRYIGAAATVNINAGFTMNGLMNAGSGTLTVGGSSSVIVGASNELVLNAASGDIVFSGTGISGVSKAVTIASSASQKVTFNTATTYSGATNVTSGTLVLGAAGSMNSSPIITIHEGATLNVSAKTSGLTVLNTQTITNNGTVSGALVVDGTLKGSGSISGALSGSGSVNPGNSPGILTAGSIGSSTLDFNFEFTQTGSPDFANAFASGNDLIRLTATTPFSAPLAAGNVINIYLNVASLTDGDTFRGAFFTDQPGDFASSIAGATFVYYLADALGGINYNGVKYSAYSGPLTAQLGTVSSLANFGAGDLSGQITQISFTGVIPEPSTGLLLLMGAAFALSANRRRNR